MFKKEQSVSIRIWHWLNSICLFLLLATVVLRKTFLGRGNINIILNKAQEVGAVLTEPQSKEIARAIRNQMWQWHPIIGFVAIGLLVFRFLIFLQNKSIENKNEIKPLIFKIIKKTHHVFYIALAVMGLTGSALYWEEALGLSKNISNNIQEVHEALQWFFVLFILSHIIGVIKAEFTEDKGLISDMINGGK
jgi:cytochrome b561